MARSSTTFGPGNPGGPGRPKRETEQSYLVAITENCPLPEWKAIVRRAVRDAKRGDRHARAWLGEYLINLPSAEEIEELKRLVADLVRKGGPAPVESPPAKVTTPP